MDSKINDVYTRVTEQIIGAIEAGADAWRMPWHATDSGELFPTNALSKKPYRGVNVLALWAAAAEHGYPSGLWGTYRQWEELGAQVRKDEKGSCVVFWKISEKGDSEEGDTAARGTRFFARGYWVFNAGQVDGFTLAEAPAPRPVAERIETADMFFGALGADVRHGGNRAYFRPDTDHIQMPVFEAFPDRLGYYATLAHESTHWTGAEHRLQRDLWGRFGSDAYAAEELIAELGAAFLCAGLGLTNEPRPDHAAYISSWLKLLRSDKRAIFTAASKAQAAADWMHALQARQIAA
jgi:antirestriction protein ArdC